MGNHQSAAPGQEIVGSYVVEKVLGKGSFAEVKLGKHIKTGEKVALKLIDKSNMVKGKRRVHMQREIRFLKLLCHPHISMLYEVVETEKHVVLIMEHASGGELLNYIRRAELKHLKEKEARRIFRQIVSAVDYCHRNNLIHRDIKPENILLDKNMDVKIIDFGFSNMFQEGVLLDSFIGSPHYAAPELLQGLKYSGPEVDMWSLGILLYVMICGRLPFKDPDMKVLYEKIKRGDLNYPDFISSDSKDLIKRLLVVDPKRRAAIPEVVRHPWFREGFSDSKSFISESSGVRAPLEKIDNSLFEELMLYGFERSEAERVLLSSEPSYHNPIVAIYYLLMDKQIRDRAMEAMAFEQSRRGVGSSMTSLFSRSSSKKGMFSRFSRSREDKPSTASLPRASTLPEGSPQGLQKSVLNEPLPLAYAKMTPNSTSAAWHVEESHLSVPKPVEKHAALVTPDVDDNETPQSSRTPSPETVKVPVDSVDTGRLVKNLETGEMVSIGQVEEQVRLKIRGRDSLHSSLLTKQQNDGDGEGAKCGIEVTVDMVSGEEHHLKVDSDSPTHPLFSPEDAI